jgi:DHA2 family multidrug resistance protein-like MFS transporter
MDLTVLNLAVPHITEELKPSASQMLWILDIYGFLIAGALVTMGTLGDRIGRRKLLLVGAAAFGCASGLAAFSRTPAMLIATRALLGVAGATLAPSTLSLIRNMFHDADERTFAIGVWATSFSVGAALGPVLGGVVLEHFWWGAVFLLNVPVMALLLVLGPLFLPEFRDPAAGRLDFWSAGLSLAAVLGVTYALKKFAEADAGARPLAALAVGLILGAAFVRRQRRLRHPLIDLDLFRRPTFRTAVAMNFLGCVVAFGAFLFLSQSLQLVLGLSPLKAGLCSLPSSVAFTIGSLVTPRASRRTGVGPLIAGGLVLAAFGFALLALGAVQGGLPALVAATFLYSPGLSPIFTHATDVSGAGAPPERAGAAASISEPGSELGGAVGMAVLGSVGMAVYRWTLHGALPEGLSSADAAAVLGSLGGAVSVAEKLAPGIGGEVLYMSRAALSRALQFTAIVNAVIALLMAVLAARVFGRRPAGR